MTKPIAELFNQLPPEEQARIEKRTQELLQEEIASEKMRARLKKMSEDDLIDFLGFLDNRVTTLFQKLDIAIKGLQEIDNIAVRHVRGAAGRMQQHARQTLTKMRE